jgi:tRNA U34 5-methylaminomethyl-2-thiouridine-forming methyltransferase MnmC
MEPAELVITLDGSHSLYRADIGEHYHSMNGAIEESGHVYIKMGLGAVEKKEIQIFEMGFGTGLNALLSWKFAVERGLNIKYYSMEKFPLDTKLTEKLNYSSLLCTGDEDIFSSMHSAEWDRDVRFSDFCLHKISGDILISNIPSGNDLVYFDAFSPEREPAVWELTVLEKVYDSMTDGGIFVTYSAKGDVRRNLQAAGFRVEKLQGAPGKMHMLRGIK